MIIIARNGTQANYTNILSYDTVIDIYSIKWDIISRTKFPSRTKYHIIINS